MKQALAKENDRHNKSRKTYLDRVYNNQQNKVLLKIEI
jgi:hypothetical protein